MRRWAFGVSCVLVLGGSLSGMAEEQAEPRTLEGLVQTGETDGPPAAPVDEPKNVTPKHPAGTLLRPKDGVKHPDLDKAWADYEAVITKVTESIKAAINKQFDEATNKGDLDAAEKWQVIGEKFEETGELPMEKETKTAVSAAVADYKNPREELAKTYEAVVKSLTREKKIAEAKAARGEFKDLAKKSEVSHNNTSMPDRSKTQEKTVDLLAMVDPARDSVMGRWSKHDDGSVIFSQQGGPNGKLEIPFKPFTDEYQLLAEVDVLGGARHIVLYVVAGKRSRFFILKPGAAENLAYVPTAHCDLEPGKTHRIIVQVRRGDISVSVDGQAVATGQAEKMDDYWRLRSDGVFGIGAHETSLIFRSVRMAKP